MQCRFCKNNIEKVFIDLINAPASNSYLTLEQLNEPEKYYPLKIYVCENCFLVQVDEYKKSDDIFDSNYAYFSSVSSSWLAHAKNYVEMIIAKLKLNSNSQVIEIASNDGYLLQYFKEKNIPNLGIEPTKSTADAAIAKGIIVRIEFFGKELAKELISTNKSADLILGNNVVAHVPDINDFVGGLALALKDTGTITLEFPHLCQLIENNQFDTIYHEHFSYFSFTTLRAIFAKHNLDMYDVEELLTHGGSLRIYAKHCANKSIAISQNVDLMLKKEDRIGVNNQFYYEDFIEKVMKVKLNLLNFLVDAKYSNKKVAAYGAAAKGNTLLNYCGIKSDLIEFVVDLAASKQNKFMPGSHLPIIKEDEIRIFKPDYILILPWNIKEEIEKQLNYVKEWGCKFVVAIPELEVF